jgi:hypothetical protein
VQVDYVEVDAVVADLNGNFIRGLRRTLKIFEDGSRDDHHLLDRRHLIERYGEAALCVRPIDPDVKSNEQLFDGRVYVVSSTICRPLERTVARARGAKFIEENMASNDLMAVVHTAGVSDGTRTYEQQALPLAARTTAGQKLDIGLPQLRSSNAARRFDAARHRAVAVGGAAAARRSCFQRRDRLRPAKRFRRFGDVCSRTCARGDHRGDLRQRRRVAIILARLAVFGDELTDITMLRVPDGPPVHARPADNQALRISQTTWR